METLKMFVFVVFLLLNGSTQAKKQAGRSTQLSGGVSPS